MSWQLGQTVSIARRHHHFHSSSTTLQYTLICPCTRQKQKEIRRRAFATDEGCLHVVQFNHFYIVYQPSILELHSGHFHALTLNLFLRPPLLQPHHHTETSESSRISTPRKSDQAPVLLFAAMQDLACNGNTCQCPAKTISHCSTSKKQTKSKRKRKVSTYPKLTIV